MIVGNMPGAGQAPRRSVPAVALAALTVGAIIGTILAGCAAGPAIEGAPCPCPAGYSCDPVQNACVAGRERGRPGDPAGGGGTSADPNPPAPIPGKTPLFACGDLGAPRPDRLTAMEYRFIVADLLNVTLTAAEVPPDVEDRDTGFIKANENPDFEAGLRALAKTVANRARPTLQRPLECAASLSDDACGRLFVDSFGQRAFRRPLNDADRSALTSAFTGGQTAGALTGGMASVIEAALASDKFLRRHDVAADPKATGLVKADAWTIASRLAALLWRSNPDEPLLAAARTGLLLQASEVENQVARMLQDPRAERMLVAFFRDWLDVDDGAFGQTGAAGVPGFTPAVRSAVLQSFDGFAQLVQRQNVPLTTLLTTPDTLADRPLASFYDLVAPTGTGFAPVPARDQQIRRGLLTSPGFLLAHSRADDSSPVKRGIAISSALLCTDLPPPPPGASVKSPTTNAITTRDKMIEHDENPACSVCHRLIDPLGFGLENYDGMGRWRTLEAGVVIDSTGVIAAAPDLSDPTFDGPAEMTESLLRSDQTQRCYVQQWFRYAFGRREAAPDTCTLDTLRKSFGQGRTQELLQAITRTDNFTALHVP